MIWVINWCGRTFLGDLNDRYVIAVMSFDFSDLFIVWWLREVTNDKKSRSTLGWSCFRNCFRRTERGWRRLKKELKLDRSVAVEWMIMFGLGLISWCLLVIDCVNWVEIDCCCWLSCSCKFEIWICWFWSFVVNLWLFAWFVQIFSFLCFVVFATLLFST